ncbi:MAG: Chromosomal replication initiator protein DnaA [Turneriella sp.]|nr:Chromosomal replication initiator protein DnaA [Turneriella sp.]
MLNTDPTTRNAVDSPYISTEHRIWQPLSAKLKKKLPQQVFQIFFADTKVEMQKEDLVLIAPSPEIAKHIQTQYLKTIQEDALEMGFQGKILAISQKIEKAAPLTNKTAQKPKQGETAYPNRIDLNPNYTFERFIKGPSNEHAYAAAYGAAQKPNSYHNPLYIYGSVGLGKTHLMMAIGNHVATAYPWLKVKYCPSEIFQSDLIEAMREKNLSYFRTRYRSVDVFLLDDVQFISKNADFTQEEIFHTFNYFYQNKKQIVISADRPPQALPQLHDRLQSRFQQGLIVDVKAPNFETRLAILKTKAEEAGMVIPNEVIKYLATRFTTQVRPMESALNTLYFTAQHEKRPIDLQMAKMSLKALPQENGVNHVTIDDILRVVSRTLHVDEALILGVNRTEQVALARHVAMYLAKKLIQGATLSFIASAFGKRDHTTVMHAEQKVRELIDVDPALQMQIDEMLEELKF